MENREEWLRKNKTQRLSHKELGQICIHPCKQGQVTKVDGKHTCTHCRVLAPGMQTHSSDTAGRRKTSVQTGAHTTHSSVDEMHEWIFCCFFFLFVLENKNA